MEERSTGELQRFPQATLSTMENLRTSWSEPEERDRILSFGFFTVYSYYLSNLFFTVYSYYLSNLLNSHAIYDLDLKLDITY
jgi:hypothetical protein